MASTGPWICSVFLTLSRPSRWPHSNESVPYERRPLVDCEIWLEIPNSLPRRQDCYKPSTIPHGPWEVRSMYSVTQQMQVIRSTWKRLIELGTISLMVVC